MKNNKLASVALAVSLGFGSTPVWAQDVVVDRAGVEQALAAKGQSDDAARATLRTLLGREDVKALAADLGLDLRRANSAVGSLEGRDLQRAANQAAVANELLVGGATTVHISLVALLLIIIIVILIA